MSEQQPSSSIPQIGQLAKALARARIATPWFVTKGGFNAHSRYPYVGHPDVMAHDGRRVLAEHGLALVQVLVEYVGEMPGSKYATLLWRGEYVLLHESGESLTLRLQATTQVNDKAAFVASTALDRTVWLRLLALAGSDDEDPDNTGPQQPTQPAGSQAAQQQAAAQAQAAQRDGVPQADPNPKLTKLLADFAVATPETIQALVDSANVLRPSLLKPERESMRVAVETARGRLSKAAAASQTKGGVA